MSFENNQILRFYVLVYILILKSYLNALIRITIFSYVVLKIIRFYNDILILKSYLNALIRISSFENNHSPSAHPTAVNKTGQENITISDDI